MKLENEQPPVDEAPLFESKDTDLIYGSVGFGAKEVMLGA